MPRKPITADSAPAPVGSYSQAIRAGNTVFISGQIPLVPSSGKLLAGDFRQQVRQVFDNISAIAAAAGSNLQEASRVTVYLLNLGNFPIVNEVMTEYLEQPFPARSVIGVSGLPLDSEIEIDVILTLEDTQ